MHFGKEFQTYATKHLGISSTLVDHYIDNLTPNIIEERQLNVQAIDIFSRLLMNFLRSVLKVI